MNLTTRDQNILRFLWNWKLLPTSVIWKRFFSTEQDSYPYRRMMKLYRSGLVTQVGVVQGLHLEARQKTVLWTLTSKGFNEVREHLGPLKEEGYKSEYPRHDFLVTAIHLGEFLGNLPAEVSLFSENQLRRYAVQRYPSWVPKEACHRPDGYWCIGTGRQQKIYALEVETSVKSISRYTQCASFYRRIKEISRVFWYVESLGEAQSVQKALKVYDESRYQIHNFILISEFETHGWNAPIILGQDRPQTLRTFLTDESGGLMEASRNLASIGLWMNPRVCRVESKSYYIPKKIKTPDSICIYPPKSAHAPSVVQKPSLHSTASSQAPKQDSINEDIGVET